MKYLGTIKSNKGHGKIDHLIRLSDYELEVLDILVVKPMVKNGRTDKYPITTTELIEAHRALRSGFAKIK